MPAIGMGLAWFGYSLTLWGYCLVRGYNVKFTDLVNPVHPYSGKWPPPANIPIGDILPGQAASTSASSSPAAGQENTAPAAGQGSAGTGGTGTGGAGQEGTGGTLV